MIPVRFVKFEHRFPLASMWLAGHETYPNLVSQGLPLRITPWWFDILNEYNRVMKNA